MYELSGIRMVRDGRTILSIDHLTIPTNEMTLILGHNGSGKSTLASVISGLVEPDAGKVMLNGKDLFALSERDRAREVAFLPQKLPASAASSAASSFASGATPGADFSAAGAAKTSAPSMRRSKPRARAGLRTPLRTTFRGANVSASGSGCS